MPTHVITNVVIIIITISVAGCGWGRRRGAKQAADGTICIVQVHEGFIVISTQAPHLQRLYLGHENNQLQDHISLQTLQLANAGGAGSCCPYLIYIGMYVWEGRTLYDHAATVYCVAAN